MIKRIAQETAQRMTKWALVCLVAFGALFLMHHAPDHAPAGQEHGPSVAHAEDDPSWDCAAQGNGRC